MKLHLVTYFLMDGQRVFFKEFKILNVLKKITKEVISKAIFNIIKANLFFIKQSGKN